MSVKLVAQENKSGDPDLAAQGFGCVKENDIKVFPVESDPADIYAFFEQNGFAVLSDSLGSDDCLLYTSPSPRDRQKSRMPSSA